MRFPFFCEEVIRNGFGVTDAVDNYGVLLDVEDRLVNEIYKYLVFSSLYFQWLISFHILPYPSSAFVFPYRSPTIPLGNPVAWGAAGWPDAVPRDGAAGRPLPRGHQYRAAPAGIRARHDRVQHVRAPQPPPADGRGADRQPLSTESAVLDGAFDLHLGEVLVDDGLDQGFHLLRSELLQPLHGGGAVDGVDHPLARTQLADDVE